MRDVTRSRWAAIGAAVAVTLGAGGVSLAQAALTSGDRPVYVALAAPCRLVDTRPDSNIGPKLGPIEAGDDEVYDIQVTGENGNCVDELAVPADATAVATNVTVIEPVVPTTGRSYFTIYPADAERPVTSNLNFVDGQTPFPNKVDVGLSDSGRIKIYNFEGEAHVAVDVFGYYIHHSHTGADIVDGSLTGDDVQDGSVGSDDIANGSVTDAHTANEPGIASTYRNAPFDLTGASDSVVSTSLRVPSDGFVDVHVTGVWDPNLGDSAAECQLQKGTTSAIDNVVPYFVLDDQNAADPAPTVFSAHRVMPIAVADNPASLGLGQTISLVCVETNPDVTLDRIHISATFFATSYEP